MDLRLREYTKKYEDTDCEYFRALLLFWQLQKKYDLSEDETSDAWAAGTRQWLVRCGIDAADLRVWDNFYRLWTERNREYAALRRAL